MARRVLRRVVAAAVFVLPLVAFAAGCGGNADRGVNKDKDRPRPADTRR